MIGQYPLRPRRTSPLVGAVLDLRAAASQSLRFLLAQASLRVATRFEYLPDRSVSAVRWWHDLVAVAIFAVIKVYLLSKFGIYDWHDSDAVGYIALAEEFRRWATWVSVPDLTSAIVPLSLLRMPGYPLLILLTQAAYGDFWNTILIALQLAAAAFATFLLYRAIWSFSRVWFVGMLGAVWFASSSIAYFERCILSDSFAISIFTVLFCGIGLVVLRGRFVGPLAIASIATAFPLLFLLRESNLLLTISLAPLILMALPRKHRLAKLTMVYAPVAAVFVVIGLWQQYRTGYFLITTGGQGNPIEALALIDKISPVFDQDNPVDRAARSVTADMTPADIARNSWGVAVKINELLAEQLNIRAPQLARLVLSRYLSVWLDHPYEMLAYVVRNQTTIRSAGVSPFIYNDPRLSDRTRDFYSYVSQQVVEWGLVNLPVLWFAVLIIAAPLRRTALITFALWLAAIIPVLFYSAMYLEPRYVLTALGPMLLVVALTIGTGIRALSRNAPA